MKYFISDSHFSHFNIIKYCSRPFKTTEDMNDTIIKNWNNIIKDDDEVYHLGDVGFGYTKTKDIVKQLKGRKILILGNHDENEKKMIEMGFEQVFKILKMKIGNKTVMLQHRPLPLTGYDAGRWQICGHTHNKTPHVDYEHKIINVSVEWINYTPVSEKHILKLMSGQK